MANSVVTETDLRMWAMDRPELNTLVDSVRFSPEAIEKAQIMAVDKFNITMPPSSTYSVETFPSMSLLMLGTWGWLLRGAAIGEASNNFQYSVAGVQINDRDKAEVFTSLGNAMWQEFVETAGQVKLTQSINKIYGVKSSEYRNRFF
jgi:hypothetical protein